MKEKPSLLGFYNYTVILTYVGMLCGLVGVTLAYEGSIHAAILALMLAGLCDMFDGTIASTKKDRTEQEKCFGIQIDSLSDLICFGVLPGALAYNLNRGNRLALGVSCFYTLCALIRLSYFNVDEQERQKTSTGSRELYRGMPVTLSGLFLPALYIGRSTLSFSPLLFPALLAVMGVLFLVPIPLKKPHTAGKVIIVVLGLLVCFGVVFLCGGAG